MNTYTYIFIFKLCWSVIIQMNLKKKKNFSSFKKVKIVILIESHQRYTNFDTKFHPL